MRSLLIGLVVVVGLTGCKQRPASELRADPTQSAQQGPQLLSAIGLYGGSFDPPTVGHLALLTEAMSKGNLETVYVWVNRSTPKSDSTKDFNTSIAERIEMFKRMLGPMQDRVRVIAEPIEGRVPLVELVHASRPGVPIRGIFGGDTIEKNIAIFGNQIEYIAFEREGSAVPDLSAKARVYKFPEVGDYSSTSVREQILSSTSPISDLAPAVEEMIREQKFYIDLPNDAAATADMRRLGGEIARTHRGVDAAALAGATFKRVQSVDARKDRLMLMAANSMMPKGGKVPSNGEIKAAFTSLEKVTKSKFTTRLLTDQRRIGVFMGSFDPIKADQTQVWYQAQKQLGLTEIVLLPLVSSRKTIYGSIGERTAILREFGDFVHTDMNADLSVIPVESLEASAKTLANLTRLHSDAEVWAVFGNNDGIFTANFNRLKDIPRLKFVVYGVGGKAPSAADEPVIGDPRVTILDQKVAMLRPLPPAVIKKIASSPTYKNGQPVRATGTGG